MLQVVMKILAGFSLLLVLAGCGMPVAEAPTASSAMGTLQFRANGEDFVRQGFETKDGWLLSFDHVYVTLADIIAYQSAPPFDAEAGGEPQADITASLDGTHTVDLAAGDEDAEPVLIGETTAPAGRYNALSWQMVSADSGPASGAVLLLEGTATKDDEAIAFRIGLDQESSNTCGDYLGDERKGILEPGGTADLEATFHFDHLFGDGEAAPDDEINTGALGFAPFAALAADGRLDVDMADLEQGLAAADFATLSRMHLAHVGEGHCHSATL